jgi:hypothetical protein
MYMQRWFHVGWRIEVVELFADQLKHAHKSSGCPINTLSYSKNYAQKDMLQMLQIEEGGIRFNSRNKNLFGLSGCVRKFRLMLL